MCSSDLPLLHHRLGDPHPSRTADRTGTQGEQSQSNDNREGHDRQAITGNQSIEKVEDWNQQVVGDVSDHDGGPEEGAEKPAGGIWLVRQCLGSKAFVVGVFACGGTHFDSLENVGLDLPGIRHRPHLKTGAIREHQHHVAPGSETTGDATHFPQLAVHDLTAVFAHPATTNGNAAAGDLESKPNGAHDGAHREGDTNQGQTQEEIENQITLLEDQLAALAIKLENPPADNLLVEELGEDYMQIQNEINALLAEWEQLQGEIGATINS